MTLLLFSCSVMSDPWQPHGLQHARPPCPSLSSGVCSDSCPLSQWCRLILCCSLLLLPSVFPSIRGLFQWTASLLWVLNVLDLQLQHQSFQWIFRVGFLYECLVWSPCSPRASQDSSLTLQFEITEIINSLTLSLLYGPTLTFIHDYWENHSFDGTDHCRQSDVSAF